jgi:acid phosphatase
MKFSTWLLGCTAAATIGACTLAGPANAGVQPNAKVLGLGIKHLVVIYQENHSFDNLYGGWDAIEGQTVNGRSNATSDRTTQVRQDNVTSYGCLYQLDVNLTSPPLAQTCTDDSGPVHIDTHFVNSPFAIEDYIPASATTCPTPNQFAANGILNGQGLTGGCTRDIVHRFYTEQYQLNNGQQNRYMTGSDASGLTMGYFNTLALPIYQYLHQAGAPHYVISDNFYQGAFGGSFLNHQLLVAGTAPLFANAVQDGSSNDLHSILDSNNMATSTPLYAPTGSVKDAQLTQKCGAPNGLACGDYAVNTIQPTYQPFAPGTAVAKQLPPLTNRTIGDILSASNIPWAWYSGGWSNADGDIGKPGWTNGTHKDHSCKDPNVLATAVWPNCPDGAFQFHHQAFNFYATFAPGTAARTEHLRDEAEFIQRANEGNLKAVSFIKPLGENNEHPGYASESKGSSHLVDLLNSIFNGPEGSSTVVMITYDEFGGQWDHASPPGTSGGAGGPHDQWGPGTRIPAILISPAFNHSGVDHTEHDTTSVMATIEHWKGLPPTSNSNRDARANDMGTAVQIGLNGIQ